MSDRKCKHCEEIIPYRIKINEKWHTLKNRTSCLKCVPFKSERQAANENSPKTIIKKCNRHGEVEHKLEYRKSGYRYRCTECLKKHVITHQEQISNKRKETKVKAIAYLGGKCSSCGYNKCIQALEFHHKDPNEKDFSISSDGKTKSFEKLKSELDKCILLCANCHRELHNS